MNRKMALFVTLFLAGGALTWIAVGNMGNNLVYYWSPAEMKSHGNEAIGATIRLGGQVVAGSIKPGNPLRFQLSDGSATVDVSTTEIPPQMFREGIGVVVEGTVDPNGLFTSNRMMVKHDNEYRAPKPGETVDQEKMKREMEQLFAEGSK